MSNRSPLLPHTRKPACAGFARQEPEAVQDLLCQPLARHGFMHGPICGLLLAEEILDGEAHTVDIAPLRLDRFKERGGPMEYAVV